MWQQPPGKKHALARHDVVYADCAQDDAIVEEGNDGSDAPGDTEGQGED